MKNPKRLIVAALSGLLFGFVCLALASSGPGKIPAPVALQIIASRTLMGFAIGISCLSMHHWSIHGLVMGALFSLPLAFSGLMAEPNEQLTPTQMFTGTIILGMIYGLLIETITSLLFKAKPENPSATNDQL